MENPLGAAQPLELLAGDPRTVRVSWPARAEPCVLWRADGSGELDRAVASELPYAPLCDGRLYLRNPTVGQKTSLERMTDFLRDHVWGGEEFIDFVKEKFYHDAFAERGVPGAPCALPPSGRGTSPPPALIAPQPKLQCLLAPSFGIAVEPAGRGFAAGEWYPVRDLPDVYASVATPSSMTQRRSSGADSHSEALVYLVAFDLDAFDLHFVLGTDHPRLGWSPRPPPQVRDPALPGPDGVGSPAPLVLDGLVSPADARRTVATFAGGFRRDHGAFRYGPFALKNHGSHYGFIEDGTIFSKLQPGLATLFSTVDGRIEMKTWSPADDAGLARIRDARQNGVPLLEYDAARGAGVPGALINAWGAGNWSGSAEEVLRTLRAGACLEQSGTRRFLIYGYFSTATPATMARVFEGYRCRYAMLLDMNALEHTYLALYVQRGRATMVEHLVQGMEQLDRSTRHGFAPRFLAVPDNRDFFYLTRRESAR